MSLSKYYLSDSPNKEALMNKDVVWLSVCDNISRMEKCLIYCDSVKMISQIRELDEQGVIHLGCRGASVSALCNIDVVRFGENYIIFSQRWNEDKYKYFLCFSPDNEIKLPNTHYINIMDHEYPEEIFIKQMATLNNGALGIDFETNGFPEDVKFSPLGLAICDTENAYYYDFDDYNESRKTAVRFYAELEKYIDKNSYRLYAFNVGFEIRCLYSMYTRFFKLQDTRVWCLIDNVKSNLKYSAQYYLHVKPWDDVVNYEQQLLDESFKMSVVEFSRQYTNLTKFANQCVLELADINKDNPNFLERYKKYNGSKWACCNQRNLGKYCCYDAVMDILIYNKIKETTHIDHKYSEECYAVYLNNQYFLAMLDLSGILVDESLLKKQKDVYDKILFNTALYLNKEISLYRLAYLKKCGVKKFKFEVSGPVAYLIDELGSYIFTLDAVDMGKEFAILTRKNPQLFERLVDKHYDQLMFIITNWKNDDEFVKAVKQKKTLYFIGNMLIDEWNLGPLYRAYREQTGCLVTPRDLQQVFEVRRLSCRLERIKEALRGRTIYSDIDDNLRWILTEDFNSPAAVDEISKIVERYHRDDYVLYSAYTDITKNNKSAYTAERFIQFAAQMKKKFSDLKLVKQFSKYYFKEEPVFFDNGSFKIPTGKTRLVPLEWSLKSGDREAPFTIPIEERDNPWCNIDDLYSIDREFDLKPFQLFYFIGIYKLNRVVAKISQTSLRSVLNDSFSVKMLDDTKCQKYNKVIENTPVKYFTKTLANESITNRWVSNSHSLFSGTEDTRVTLQVKKGTHFILPNKDESYTCNEIYEIDGLNFRRNDLVKLDTGEMKYVYELNEDDCFDREWISGIIEADKKLTGSVNW